MYSPLPYLEDTDLLDSLISGAAFPGLATSHLEPADNQQGDVESLDADDIKSFLELVEKPGKTEAEEQSATCMTVYPPQSPFFGRTTPQFYESTPVQWAPESRATETRSVPDFTQLTDGICSNTTYVGNLSSNSTETNKDEVEQDVAVSTPADGAVAMDTKEQIKLRIQNRRRQSGLAEVTVDWKPPEQEEELTDKDVERRKRRRDSNRRAAAKSRIKKRRQNDELATEMSSIEKENCFLRTEMTGLRQELENIKSVVREHLLNCNSQNDDLHQLL